MKHTTLATKYRPQRFAELVGQELPASALSRAAAEDRVAPAYLLSGTRGVGKTTIARIFAKALNCSRGPAAEPCNECSHCRQITAGNHIDVNEIDGASNTGVDDVRALRENIGFVPMDGRYKIFIVDEAHMLSKNAFNALLKTLEEPPPHTVFIFATTEAHRFPATIVSRCQHYVFRHLPEESIFHHLCSILNKEDIAYDESAVWLVAKRASGSVRDSLSLLDQVLALCDGRLDVKTARDALGLASQDMFEKLFQAIPASDCAGIVTTARELLDSGIDIGFFIRELAANLRNLFLLGDGGPGIMDALHLTPDERIFLDKHVKNFAPGHIHAAWQMTLDNQRRITQNPDPGSALELFLINLALIPRLLPIEKAPPQVFTGSVNETTAKYEAAKPAESHTEADPVTNAAHSHSWQEFCLFCANLQKDGVEAVPKEMLHQIKAQWAGDKLTLHVPANLLWKRMEQKLPLLHENLRAYCGEECPEVILSKPDAMPMAELMEECKNSPEVKLLEKILDARVSDCSPNTEARK